MLNRYFKLDSENSDFLYANIVVRNIYFGLVSLDYILFHNNFKTGIYHDEHTFYFFHIQSLLTACGNIFNVFNNSFSGINKKIKERCERLKNILNISTEEFPLIFKKEARNTNIHFDERYDDFNGQIGDYNLLDAHTDEYLREVIMSKPHLRTYDKENHIYYTYGRNKKRIVYNLDELKRELDIMLDRIINNPVFNSAWV